MISFVDQIGVQHDTRLEVYLRVLELQFRCYCQLYGLMKLMLGQLLIARFDLGQ